MDTKQSGVVSDSGLTRRFNVSRKQITVILVIIAALSAVFLYRSFAAESVQIVSSIEGEQLTTGPRGATTKVVPATDASGKAAMGLYSKSTATWTITPPADANRIIVKAKGTNCNGAAPMVISVNGVAALSVSAVGTEWVEYTANASLAKGRAVQVQIAFTSDYWNPPTCDRNLFIDKVSLGVTTSQSDKVGSIEAEQMIVQSGGYVKSINYSGASGSKAMQFLSRGSVDTSTIPAADVLQLQVVAYGTLCNGAPKMEIKINGEVIKTIEVSSTTWKTYDINTSLPKNKSTKVSVDYNNDFYDPPRCDRNLYVDKVDLFGKILTSPVPVPEPAPVPTPKPAPAPTPEAPSPSTPGGSSMVVGLDIGNFGINGVNDVKGKVGHVRLDPSRSTALSNWKSAGIKTDINFVGNYNSNGVSGLGNPQSWAAATLSQYRSFGCDPTQCPTIEILNEPGGTWFWGSNATSQTNATAYARLLEATYDAFHSAYGTDAPKVLGTYDGVGGTVFGDRWWSTVNKNKVDGVIVHPYGLTSNRTQSAKGNQSLVTSVRSKTNKPVYITEVGWPTAEGQPNTGDSFQWSETEQAANIHNFISWARSTGYVNAVYIFNYRDYGTNNYYGVTRPNGSHKPSFNALRCAAQSKPLGCQ